MPRNRVLSFMSEWRQPRSPTTTEAADPLAKLKRSTPPPENTPLKKPLNVDTFSPQPLPQKLDPYAPGSPRSPATPSRARGDSRPNTRPNSMIQTYNPPQMEVAQDTPPELAPIFSYLNSHSNKLYQEGYFLKLHDLDSRGRPSPDRVWNECFAQLVGTVLSLWDAAALDTAGEDGEVVPTFVNLSDASIKMIESLPMNGAQGGSLQNVLSISTAANNRYLLHFNSLNSLTQWTAGIRLAMFEHSTLQEAYTGSLIAGKGRYLNNIKAIMERSRFAHDDWARVRFGAGTSWRRCWCIISPPDEKEYQKAQKTLKKSSAYGRAQVPKGDIKFYDTRKITKKTKPVATITDAFAAYAIYPQSKPLIDQSTLVKLEGLVTIHGTPETTTEGFVFVMPEVHAAVSGFEMMLRWLFPVYDTFNLYGRPTRLIADTLDQRGLMFAMPKDRRYGHLDTLDISGLIHTSGSQNWSERQWRKEMKKLTSTRMMNQMEESPRNSRQISQRRNTTSRQSLPPTRSGIQFQEPVTHSTPGSRSTSPAPSPGGIISPPRRTDSAPPQALHVSPHKRSASDAVGYRKYMAETPSRLSHEQSRDDEPPPPPRHGGVLGARFERTHGVESLERVNSSERNDARSPYEQVAAEAAATPYLPPPEPVLSPPAFTHSPNSRPATQPYQAPELRRAHSNVDAATLYQMQDATRAAEVEAGMPEQNLPYRNNLGVPADQSQYYAAEYGNESQRDPRRRLSTIPGSPFAGGENEYFAAQTQMPQMDGVVESRDEQEHERPELVQLHSSHSITRKPVPKQLPQVPADGEQVASRREEQASQVRAIDYGLPESPVSAAGSFYDAVVDPSALDAILNDDRASTSASSATPDYESVESTHEEEVKNKQKEWQRPGKLKTVGDPDMPRIDVRSGGAGKLDTYSKDAAEQAAEMPPVDFGPTLLYKPTSRPGTSGTITQEGMDKRSRSRSADRLRQSPGSRLSGYFATPSPGESNRHSYFGGRTTPTGIEAADSPNYRHSIAWTPGAGSDPNSPGIKQQKRQTLTPEEWVQYRASLASQPQAVPPRRKSPIPNLAHMRHASTNSVQQLRQSMSKTPPPFSRANSGDWTQQAQNRTPPSRPNSRGAGAYLNQSSGGLINSNSTPTLSAKEQMHVARATGSPLINMAAGGKKEEEQSPGLVGALQAREREKAAMGKGIRNAQVQQAILARQQQQFQAEAEAQAQVQLQMQQQAQQQAQQAQAQQYQQMAYQQAMMSQQQQQVPNINYQQPQMPPMQQRTSSYGHVRAQSTQIPMQQQGYQPGVQYAPQAGGYGGQFVQQQGMVPQQQGVISQQQAYYNNTQQGGQGQWQPPRK